MGQNKVILLKFTIYRCAEPRIQDKDNNISCHKKQQITSNMISFLNLLLTLVLFFSYTSLSSIITSYPSNSYQQMPELLTDKYYYLTNNTQYIIKFIDSNPNFLPILTNTQKIYCLSQALKVINKNEINKKDEEQLFNKIFKSDNKLAQSLLKHDNFEDFINSDIGYKHRQLLQYHHKKQLSHQDKITVLESALQHGQLGELTFWPKQYRYPRNDRRLFQESTFLSNNWMSKLNENTTVNLMSIPGTHDSSADSSPSFIFNLVYGTWKTQNLNFQQQLAAGVRFLDLRIKCDNGKNISLNHGPVPLGPLSKYTNAIKAFLQQNPQQFIITLVQKQSGNASPKNCGDIFLKQLKTNLVNISTYCYKCNPNIIPTYAQLKGKIWLIEGGTDVDLQGQLLLITSNSKKVLSSNMWVNQDLWNGPISKKQDESMRLLTNPEYKKLLRLNFLSQSFDFKSGKTPLQFANIINPWFKKQIIDKKLVNVGIILVDFINQDIAEIIYKTNS